MNTIDQFTTAELLQELDRRKALQAKAAFERRTAITKFIREHRDTFMQFAQLLGNEELKNSIHKVDEYVYNCVNVLFAIEDGKPFMDAIFNGDKAIWAEFVSKENDETDASLGA